METAPPINEESIIQQRLLYKTGSLRNLYDSIADFTYSLEGHDPKDVEQPLSKESIYDELLEQFDSLEFQMVKAEVANTNNLRDIEYYKEKCKDREGQIKTIKAEILDLSDELRISEIKKNMKCKFEITSKVIVKYEPEDEIRKLKKLEGEFDHNTRMIDLRRKQLEVALVTLNDFQKSIEELTK